MKKFLTYMKPYLPFFIIGPILMICEVIANVQIPTVVARMINIGAANRDISYIMASGIQMLFIILFGMASGIGAAYCAAKASVGFSCDIRTDLFEKIQKFSFANIDTFSTGSLVTRLTNDITQVRNLVEMAMRMMLRGPGMLIGAFIMAVKLNAQLSVVFLVIVPALSLLILTIVRTAFPRFNMMQKKLDRLNSAIQEALINVRVIKSFVRGDYEENKFAKTNEDLKNATIHAVKIILLVTPVMTLAMNVGTIAIVWFGGKGIMAGTIPVGDVMAFITYVTQILMALGMLAMVFMQSAKAVASLNRINEVMNTTVDLTDEHAKFKEKTVQEGRIEFRNVSFQYYKNSEKKVLDNISFTILPGEVVGIIGPTGCGKTTLVQMIPRLYDVDAGEVLVDGINVKDYSLQHLRDAVGMVLQKNVLFSGTIIENLKWGNEDATQAEIKKCAKAAQADGFIQNFAKQYETELGQGGVNLSGGQKQRICIARTLLKNPKILILDDSTSAVDTTTEAKILQALRENFQDITKIIIAQRISSVMAADKIIVMDNGQIAGIGTHTELLQSCKTYREIYNSQTSVGEVIA